MGFDYADQRYYASGYGRFNTADPYPASAGPSDQGSWNRYHRVRRGLCVEDTSTGYFYNGYAQQQEAAYTGIEGAGFNDNLA